MRAVRFTSDQVLRFGQLLAFEPSFLPTTQDLEFCRSSLSSIHFSDEAEVQLHSFITLGQLRLQMFEKLSEIQARERLVVLV